MTRLDSQTVKDYGHVKEKFLEKSSEGSHWITGKIWENVTKNETHFMGKIKDQIVNSIWGSPQR